MPPLKRDKIMKLSIFGANQTVITIGNNEIFFSYDTPVAAFVSGIGYVRTEQKFSATTSKHINAWAGKNAATKPQSFFDDFASDVTFKMH